VSRDDGLVEEIEQDLQRSGSRRVVYLEGKSDPGTFFALLGVPSPLAVDRDRFVHEGVLVRGLHEGKGSGASSVRRRVALAVEHRYAGIYGFVDGDGASYQALARDFDAPFKGPLFRWKAYAIENLLVRTCWPGYWGREPEWAKVFRRYAPYVALNRLHAKIEQDLAAVGLAEYQQPKLGGPRRSNSEVIHLLKAQRHLLPKHDVLATYRDEVAQLRASTLDEQHARLNGKWLVEVLAPEVTHRSPEQCRAEWIQEATHRGGDPEVRALWARAIRPSS
jgi:hypothetical protein